MCDWVGYPDDVGKRITPKKAWKWRQACAEYFLRLFILCARKLFTVGHETHTTPKVVLVPLSAPTETRTINGTGVRDLERIGRRRQYKKGIHQEDPFPRFFFRWSLYYCCWGLGTYKVSNVSAEQQPSQNYDGRITWFFFCLVHYFDHHELRACNGRWGNPAFAPPRYGKRTLEGLRAVLVRNLVPS